MNLKKRDWSNIKLAIGIQTNNENNECDSMSISNHSKLYGSVKRILTDKIICYHDIEALLYALDKEHCVNEETKELIDNSNIDVEKTKDFFEYIVKLRNSISDGTECALKYKYINALSMYNIPSIDNFLYGIYKVDDANELKQILLNIQPNANLNWIDVSGMTDFSHLFENMPDFNGDVSLWNVTNAINMEGMFKNCTKFNCNISRWWVNNVINMREMFSGCTLFDKNISNWFINYADVEDMFTGCDIKDTNKPSIYAESDDNEIVDIDVTVKEFLPIIADCCPNDYCNWKMQFVNSLMKFTTITQFFKTINFDSEHFWNSVEKSIDEKTIYCSQIYNDFLHSLICYSKAINNDAQGRTAKTIDDLHNLRFKAKITEYTFRELAQQPNYIKDEMLKNVKHFCHIFRMPFDLAISKLDMTKYLNKKDLRTFCDKLYIEPLFQSNQRDYLDSHDIAYNNPKTNVSVLRFDKSKYNEEMKVLQETIIQSVVKPETIVSLRELHEIFKRHEANFHQRPILLIYGKNDPYTIFYTTNTSKSINIDMVKCIENKFVFAPHFFDTKFVFYCLGRFFTPTSQEIEYADWMADNCGQHTFFWVLHRDFVIPENVKNKFDCFYLE